MSSKDNETNGILFFLSIFVPIVGFVLYFVKKEEEPISSKNYLWGGIAGFIIAIVLLSA